MNAQRYEHMHIVDGGGHAKTVLHLSQKNPEEAAQFAEPFRRDEMGGPGHSHSASLDHAMKNGRCRMHGGKSPGAPATDKGFRDAVGNKNAFKHGRYTADAIALHRSIAALIRNARQLGLRI
jgi:hypothetical protein